MMYQQYNRLSLIFKRFNSHAPLKSKQITINPGKLDFTKRNEVVLQNLNDYYPSLSTIPNNKHSYITINAFKLKFSKINTDLPDEKLLINGRVKNLRYSGKKICFIDLVTNHKEQLQLIINYNIILGSDSNPIDENVFTTFINFLKIGDYIQSYGYPGRSQSRQKTLSLKCNQMPRILSVAQLPLPPKLIDHHKIKNNRVVDYQVNGISTVLLRSFIVKQIRLFLDNQNFVEVETPILSRKANGALAKPFETKLSQISKEQKIQGQDQLQLRIAPELWLKRLVIGGIERVYEIGKVFRNEGIDQTHNPEFSTLEFYQSYASMESLIKQSEELFKFLIVNLRNSGLLKEGSPSYNIVNELFEILSANDFKFKRIEFLPTLTKEVNNEIDFSNIDLSNPDILLNSIPHDIKQSLFPSANQDMGLSSQQILNKLCSHYIESKHCNSLLPTLIYHHPTVMSPLAKTNSLNESTTKRFEIFINGKEYINAYEEENCPQYQLSKFLAQKDANETYNDLEALSVDNEYVDSMKWGMPPIGGLGLGIDRLCMLLLNKTRIEEVLSFGCVDDVNRQ